MAAEADHYRHAEKQYKAWRKSKPHDPAHWPGVIDARHVVRCHILRLAFTPAGRQVALFRADHATMVRQHGQENVGQAEALGLQVYDECSVVGGVRTKPIGLLARPGFFVLPGALDAAQQLRLAKCCLYVVVVIMSCGQGVRRWMPCCFV